MKNVRMIGAALTAVAIVMAGCASEPSRPYSSGPYDSRQGSYSYGQGVVDRIEVVRRGDSHNIAGTVIGGIAGGLIGHQIGGGSGNTAATIAGVAGGAVAGNQVQNRQRGSDETFRVTIRMDNGVDQVITQGDIRDLRTGDRVRVEGGRIYRM